MCAMMDRVVEKWGPLLKKKSLAHFTEQERSEYFSLSRMDREDIARKANTRILYSGKEAGDLRIEANAAMLRAAPRGYALAELNGIDVGAGSRVLSPHIMPVDGTREHFDTKAGRDGRSCLLSSVAPLPFREGCLDFIVAAHTLEHTANPIPVVHHWISILKPGGGIGLILADYRYTWDAKNDGSKRGHKWNPYPDFLEMLYDRYWSKRTSLEHFATLQRLDAFDMVIRKDGDFIPFLSSDEVGEDVTGKELAESGEMFGEENLP